MQLINTEMYITDYIKDLSVDGLVDALNFFKNEQIHSKKCIDLINKELERRNINVVEVTVKGGV